MSAQTISAARPAGLSASLAAALWVAAACGAALAQETKPYDDRLLRLSEVMGAVHFLRELCGNNDGMLWRDRMQDLINAEGASPTRRLKLTRAFNTGYRSYSRTYATCTPSAQTAIARFLAEGSEIADNLVKTVP